MSDLTTQFTPQELNTEEWRDVPNYEGLYLVSNLGRVRSLDRVIPHGRHKGCVKTLKGRMLLLASTVRGYLFVGLARDGGVLQREVHILVASAFIGPRPEGYHLHHKDGDHTNNRPENLEYLLGREHHSLHSRGEKNNRSRLVPEQVREIRRLLAEGRTQKSIADMYGVNEVSVHLIYKGKHWAHLP
jgi:hypothetical protein